MIIQLQFSEIMGCANLFQRFLTLAVYCIYTQYFIDMRTQRDLACAQMKFHKHMRDMRDLLCFKAYFQFNVTFQFNNIYTPAPRRGRGVYCFTSVRPRYFSSHFSYRYPISWEAFLDPSDSYFLFADFVDFYTH